MNRTLKLIALILTLTMTFSTYASAEAIQENQEAEEIAVEPAVPFSFYTSFTGTVKSIEEGNEGTIKVYLEDKDNSPAYFVLTEQTYYVDDVKIEAGKEITGYYESGKPMIMIYPPQYSIDIVAVEPSEGFMKADKFDTNLLSSDKQLKLNISTDTEIIWENNTQINWFKAPTAEELEAVLTNRKMIVFYDFTTKSIPAQTTPNKIIVLSQQEAEPLNIFVEDAAIETPAAYINENGTVMVPLRAISEALKYEVTWNNEERCIMVGSDVQVKIDASSITAAGKVIELESAALIKDDRTYVPLSFFKEALGVNVVSFFENNIIINSGRYMAD
jgi:hypothetical protein